MLVDSIFLEYISKVMPSTNPFDSGLYLGSFILRKFFGEVSDQCSWIFKPLSEELG